MIYKAVEDCEFKEYWHVEAFDAESECDRCVATFISPNAEACAREYAAWKNSGGKISETTAKIIASLLQLETLREEVKSVERMLAETKGKQS